MPAKYIVNNKKLQVSTTIFDIKSNYIHLANDCVRFFQNDKLCRFTLCLVGYF